MNKTFAFDVQPFWFFFYFRFCLFASQNPFAFNLKLSTVSLFSNSGDSQALYISIWNQFNQSYQKLTTAHVGIEVKFSKVFNI